MHRRTALKLSLGLAGLASGRAALSKAVVKPRRFEAFTSPDMMDAARLALDAAADEPSDQVLIEAPRFIKKAGVVDVTVSTSLPSVDAIALMVSSNLTPLAAVYHFSAASEPYVLSRLDIAKTGDIIAVARSNGRLFSNAHKIIITARPAIKPGKQESPRPDLGRQPQTVYDDVPVDSLIEIFESFAE